MMRALRITYYTVMTACLFGGMLNGIRAYYVIFFFQLFLVLFSLGLSVWTALSFAYIQELGNDRGVKGETARLRISIHNDKPFPFTSMRIHVQAIVASDCREEVFSLMPRTSIDFQYDISLAYRGEHALGMTKLTITDVFGLIPIRFDMRRLSYYKMRSILVYPRLLRLNRVGGGPGDAQSFSAQNLVAASQGESLFAPRAYIPGDSAKRIHWKVTARRRELYSKQYDTPIKNRALLFLDNAEQGLLFADTACECVAALASYSLRHGHAVTITNTGGYPPLEAVSQVSITPLMEHLARLPFDATGSITEAVLLGTRRTGAHSAVFVIAAACSQDLAEALTGLASRNIRTTLILVDEDGGQQRDLPESVAVCRVTSGEELRARLSGVVA